MNAACLTALSSRVAAVNSCLTSAQSLINKKTTHKPGQLTGSGNLWRALLDLEAAHQAVGELMCELQRLGEFDLASDGRQK